MNEQDDKRSHCGNHQGNPDRTGGMGWRNPLIRHINLPTLYVDQFGEVFEGATAVAHLKYTILSKEETHKREPDRIIHQTLNHIRNNGLKERQATFDFGD